MSLGMLSENFVFVVGVWHMPVCASTCDSFSMFGGQMWMPGVFPYHSLIY